MGATIGVDDIIQLQEKGFSYMATGLRHSCFFNLATAIISMFIKYLLVFLLFAASTVPGFAEDAASAEPVKQMGKIIGGSELVFPDWFKESFMDFREDAADASIAGKHLLLFFHVAGCPYCKKMLHDNFEQGENAEILQKDFDVIAIDANGGKDVIYSEKTTVSEHAFAQVLNVHYTPTLLFMNADNKVVARLNGYRSPREFRTVLNFVREKAYKETDLASYRQAHLTDKQYALKDNPRYLKTTNLQKLAQQDKPLLILFEDTSCDGCERFHKDVFDIKDTEQILNKYNVVRLDALSDTQIIDPEGHKTTPKQWLKKLAISYRPAVLLYSEGKEIERVTGLLKSFHFQQLLKYVAEKKYTEFDSWLGYEHEQTEKLLKSGKDVDIWK